MKSSPTNTTWQDGVSKKSYPAFTSSASSKADVVIVGGGIAGIISAYLLSKAGKQVVLLEKGEIGSGTTSYTTAFITQSLDSDPGELVEMFGREDAREIIQSHGEARDLIASLVKKEKIDCDFSPCSNFIYINDEKQWDDLKDEAEESRACGLQVELVKDGSALGFANAGYMEIKGQARFHPLKFLYALAEKAVESGAHIYENTEVTELKALPDARQTVVTKKGTIECDYVVVATYKPFDNPKSLYFKKGTYVSYVLELIVHGMKLKEGTFEDVENPYHYLRVDAHPDGGQRVVVGGEDHRKDVPVSDDKNFNALLEYVDSIIPPSSREVTKRWSGIMLEPVDGLPSLGRIDERNVLYTLAFSGNGMTYSAISGMLFTDIIIGSNKYSAWKRIYDAARKPTLKSLTLKGRDYAQELIHGAVKNAVTQKKKPDPDLPEAPAG